MAQVVWSDRAIKDIDQIASYIAKDSLQYAKEYVKLFFERAQVLEKYPYFGRAVPEINMSSIRQILCDRYRIIYEVINRNEIGIITVHHQSRSLENNPSVKKFYKKRKK